MVLFYKLRLLLFVSFLLNDLKDIIHYSQLKSIHREYYSNLFAELNNF